MWEGDIKEFDNTQFQECKYLCLETSDCVAVIWVKKYYNEYKPKGKCHLKNNQHKAPTTCDFCITAKISCIKTDGTPFILLYIQINMYILCILRY